MRKVSLVVPIYKVESTLKKCIDSILSQSYKNIEVILVDDGSPDNCGKICDRYSKDDFRIKVVHKKNGGLTDARLAGFKICTGDYICFIDSDDYIAENYVEKQVLSLEENGADISICGFKKVVGGKEISVPFSPDRTILQRSDFEKKLILPAIFPFEKNSDVIPNFLWLRMFKKEVISKNCFISEREVFTEDIFFNLFSYDRALKIAFCPENLYFYRVGDATLSSSYRNNKWNMELERYRLLQKYCKDRNIPTDDNFLYVLFTAVVGTVINQALSKNYKIFSAEIKKVLAEKNVQKMLEVIDKSRLSKGNKVRLNLLKTNSIRTLYLIERIK